MVAGRRARRVTAAVIAGVCCATAAAAQPPRTAAEADVKAAFVYHFGKFVEWPPEAFAGADRVIICTLGAEPISDALEATLQGRTIHDKHISVRRLLDPDRAANCHILVIGQAAESSLPAVLRTLDERPVLTIGDLPAASAAGTMIAFTREGNKVRFVIDATAAERARLKISSQLMKLAVEVRGGGGGERP